MANRRFGNNPQRGGGGNGGGMNRGGNFGAPSSNINPWQGGVAPGNSGPNFPTSQLALTLANLIQQSTQQQVPSSDGPPSLLTMNTSPGFFNNQDQYNNQNRFSNRGRPDFRRSEPYNKNRGGGWRNEGRNNGPARGGHKNRPNFNNKNSPKRDNKMKNNDKREKREKQAENASIEKNKEKDQPAEAIAAAGISNDNVDEDKHEGKATKFDGLPNSLLHCFVCNKSMWDGESFQNHIGGKAHKQMISSLEESFQITVNILRENMRLSEERKMIEYERMQRSRRYHHNNSNEPESHCNMCDLKFMGKIVVHRQTEGHQRLKRFLHPKCHRCNLEFPSRMEWVDHQFVPEHLFKLKSQLEEKSVDLGEYKLRVQAEIDTEPLLDENIQNEDDNPVLELHDDMTNLFNRIPVFRPNRGVGKASMKPATGFICDICKLFMPSEQESKVHMKSFAHYHAFVDAAKTKFQNAANEKKKKEDSNSEETTEDKEEKEEATENENKDDEAMKNLLDDIYDPHAADAEEAEESSEDQPVAETKVETETPAETLPVEAVVAAEVEPNAEVTEEEESEETKQEPEAINEEELKEESSPPTTPMTRAKRSNVKNGAGPKSKKCKN